MRYAAGDLDLDTTPLWGSDAELRDDLWRAENPGASAMRGLLWALPISTGMWALLIGGLVLLLS